MKKEIMEWIKAFIFAAIFVFVINIFIGTTTVFSTSMYPTLIEKDVLILNKISPIERGDIVSFKSELEIGERSYNLLNPIQKLFVSEHSRKNLIKRVIGVPGDKVDVYDGKVFINGEEIDESYVSSYTNGEAHIEKLEENQYFMMGDNRSVSLDSRSSSVGVISGDNFIGKVLIRILPLSKFGKIK